MSEPFLERLTRFTPDAGRLDRDALLFEAGRGSARPDRRWIALAASLACTQALTLALLGLRQVAPVDPMAGPMAGVAAPPSLDEPPPSEAITTPDLWSARRKLLGSRSDDRHAPALTLIESGPPLRAFPHPPRS